MKKRNYTKTVNHTTGTVTERMTNPITGTRHVYRRKKHSPMGCLTGFLIFLVICAVLGAFGRRNKTEAPSASEPAAVTETTAAAEAAPETRSAFVRTYTVNSATGVIHTNSSCIRKIAEDSRLEFKCELSELEAKGYTRCGICWK